MRLLAALLMLLVPSPALADRIDTAVRSEMERQHIPGLSFALCLDGKPVRVRGYGLANLEHRVPVTARTVFQLASVTKPMVATGLLMLREEDRLRLDDPLSRHLTGTPETWKGITLRHLLNHTSGIPAEVPAWTATSELTDEQILQGAAEQPVRAAPGESWEYNSVGYHLLGMVIRKVSGVAWHEFLTRKVFQPLRMTETRQRDPAEVILNRADGYRLLDGRLRRSPVMGRSRSGTASGGLVSTAADMGRWLSALQAGKLLPRSAIHDLWTPTRLRDGTEIPYGLGWGTGEIEGHRTAGHGGYTLGFRSALLHLPEHNLSLVVLMNGQHADPDGVAERILAAYDPSFRRAGSH